MKTPNQDWDGTLETKTFAQDNLKKYGFRLL